MLTHSKITAKVSFLLLDVKVKIAYYSKAMIFFGGRYYVKYYSVLKYKFDVLEYLNFTFYSTTFISQL